LIMSCIASEPVVDTPTKLTEPLSLPMLCPHKCTYDLKKSRHLMISRTFTRTLASHKRELDLSFRGIVGHWNYVDRDWNHAEGQSSSSSVTIRSVLRSAFGRRTELIVAKTAPPSIETQPVDRQKTLNIRLILLPINPP